MASAVTQKGQVTIPKPVRDAMGVKPGTLVEVESDGRGGARIVKLEGTPAQEHPIAKFVGTGLYAGKLTTDEYMRMIRGEPDW